MEEGSRIQRIVVTMRIPSNYGVDQSSCKESAKIRHFICKGALI